MKKRVIRDLKRAGARGVRVERIPPEVGPAAPRWSVTAEKLVPAPFNPGVVRLVVRAVSKSVRGLPGAWDAAFRAARQAPEFYAGG